MVWFYSLLLQFLNVHEVLDTISTPTQIYLVGLNSSIEFSCSRESKETAGHCGLNWCRQVAGQAFEKAVHYSLRFTREFFQLIRSAIHMEYSCIVRKDV